MAITKQKPAAKKAPAKKPPAQAKSSFHLEQRLAELPVHAGEQAPDMPAKALGKDAAELARVSEKYGPQLRKMPGFDGVFLDELQPRGEALLDADKQLAKVRKATAKKSGGPDLMLEATRLRAAMLSGALYLFRKDPVVVAELEAIAEGEGLDDLITDLNDLADLAAANQATFALDGKLPENVHLVARELANTLLGRTDTSEVVKAVAHRNRCFQLANAAFDEVYATLGFILRGKDEQLSDLFRPYRARNMAALRSRQARLKKLAGGGTPQ